MAIQSAVRVLPTQYAVSEEQGKALGVVLEICSALHAEKKRRAPTNAELAKKYAVSHRTVRYWRRAGCPFERGQWQVLSWLAVRRYAPARTEAKFKRQLARHRMRHLARGMRACFDEARLIKLSFKHSGVELPPDDWLRNYRCPKGTDA